MRRSGGGNGGTGSHPSGSTDGETVVNPGQPPTATATYNGGEIAMLDGTGGTYPHGDPLRYTWTQKISLALPESPQDVEVAGNYAYVADGAAGLRIIDASNATNATTPTIS